MNALDAASAPAPAVQEDRPTMLGVLRGLLLLEAAAALALTIFLSMLAAAVGSGLGDGPGETTIRFAAGGTILFAIFAAFASRGVRRRRPGSWTLSAILQVLLAIGTGVAIMIAEWHPLFIVGFGLAAVIMLVLSAGSVRRGLGQA